MASLLHLSPPRLLFKTPLTISTSKTHSSLRFLSFSFNHLSLSLSSTRIRSSSSSSSTPADPDGNQVNITDDWGEKAEPEELQPKTVNYLDSDPLESGGDAKQEEEKEEEEDKSIEVVNNGSVGPTPISTDEDAVKEEREDKAGEVVADLKRCLVDSVYGLNLGFNASLEVRAEVLELVNQLEALNPTPNPVESADLLDGNWVLL